MQKQFIDEKEWGEKNGEKRMERDTRARNIVSPSGGGGEGERIEERERVRRTTKNPQNKTKLRGKKRKVLGILNANGKNKNMK